MSYKVETLEVFERQTKRLLKKYPSLKSELVTLITSLKENPFQGTALGNECYKIRIGIASKGRGKSGGGRIITHIVIDAETIHLMSIYDKSDKENISDDELDDLLLQL